MSSAVREPPLGALARADGVAVLHRTLAELCRAEMPLAAALRASASDLGDRELADAVRAMAADVESGAPLGEAYAAHADALPRLYRGLIEAGTATGDLPGALEEIARHAETRAEVESRLRRALAYPTVAAGFVVVVGVALTVVVGPQLDTFAREATTGDATGSGGGTGLVWLLGQPWLPLALVGAAALGAGAAIALFTALRRPLDGCRGVTSRAFRWPVLGRLRLYAALSTAAAALSVLVRRRTPLADAFSMTATTCEEPSLSRAFQKMSESADGGASLAQALREGGVFAPSLVWTVDVAEQRGDAADALDDVARIYRERLSRAADRAALWITPAAEILVGAFVLLLALAFLGRLGALTMRLLG